MTFTEFFAEDAGLPLDQAQALLDMCDAMGPHLTTLQAFLRFRMGDHLDRCASTVTQLDSPDCFMWRGRAKEAADLAQVFFNQVETIDELTHRYRELMEAK